MPLSNEDFKSQGRFKIRVREIDVDGNEDNPTPKPDDVDIVKVRRGDAIETVVRSIFDKCNAMQPGCCPPSNQWCECYRFYIDEFYQEKKISAGLYHKLQKRGRCDVDEFDKKGKNEQ